MFSGKLVLKIGHFFPLRERLSFCKESRGVPSQYPEIHRGTTPTPSFFCLTWVPPLPSDMFTSPPLQLRVRFQSLIPYIHHPRICVLRAVRYCSPDFICLPKSLSFFHSVFVWRTLSAPGSGYYHLECAPPCLFPQHRYE